MLARTPTISSAMTAIARQIKATQPAYRLVHETTGAEIPLPSRMKCWDGAEILVREFRPSRYQSSGGYILTDLNEKFVASVVGAKVVAA